MFLRRVAVGVSRRKKAFSSRSGDESAYAASAASAAISELNEEMQSIFGEPPPDGFASSVSKEFADHEPRFESPDFTKFQAQEQPASESRNPISDKSRLTHIGIHGEAQMVDVSTKDNTKRTALAFSKVILGKQVFDLVLANQMGKGDVLGVAKIAGINGAKQTSSLIPLCHNIALTHVRVDLKLNPEDFSVDIEGEASCTGKTGVEMEAMTAVSVAGLTVYDMCKAASKEIRITDVRLERKTGGKSGYWSRDD